MQQPSLQQNRAAQIISRFEQQNHAVALLTPTSSCPSLPGLDLLSFHGVLANYDAPLLDQQLNWLSEVQHVAYQYQRSKNGKRMVFSDGVFCDFYLYSPDQLSQANADNWQLEWCASSDAIPAYPVSASETFENRTEWLLGELLTNLTLGLRHFAQNEKLAAFQCVQQNALNHLCTLMLRCQQQSAQAMRDTTWEALANEQGCNMAEFASGYEHSPNAAQAILKHLESMHCINHFVKDQILNLIASCLKPVEQ